MRKILKWLLFALALLAPVSVAAADMIIRNYDPARNDRFYVGADKAFIGSGYNWSGIGRTSDGRWATLISPDFFVTVWHWYPLVGSTVTFYSDNTTNNPITATVTNVWHGPNVFPAGDICLGRLDHPVNVMYYPLPAKTDYSWYNGQVAWMWGKPNKLGKNVVWSASWPLTSYYYDDPGIDSECLIQGGDSGGPSFELFGNTMVLIGNHSSAIPNTFYDTSVPAAVSYFDSVMSAYGESTHKVYFPHPGDANLDGIVGPEDFGVLKDNFGLSELTNAWGVGDFNGDGEIGPEDFGILKDNFGYSYTTIATPEPTTSAIIIVGLLVVGLRRW